MSYCKFFFVSLPSIVYFQNESDYSMELRRIELRAFRMQSEHSTTELQPLKNRDYWYFPDTCFLPLDYLHYIGVFGGLNSGLFTCEASTLPLSYNPLTYARLL